MGDVVLGELLKDRSAAKPASTQLDAFLIAVTGEDLAPLLKLAHTLRDRGVSVEYGLRQAAVRKHLELAAARGAARAVILGPDERRDGVAVVRDLQAGTESKVPLDRLTNAIFLLHPAEHDHALPQPGDLLGVGLGHRRRQPVGGHVWIAH